MHKQTTYHFPPPHTCDAHLFLSSCANTSLGIYRVTKPGLFRYLISNTWPRFFWNQGAISLGKEDVVQQGPSCHGAMSSRLTFGIWYARWNGARTPWSSIPPGFPVVSTVVFEKRPSDNKAGNGDNLGFHRCENRQMLGKMKSQPGPKWKNNS